MGTSRPQLRSNVTARLSLILVMLCNNDDYNDDDDDDDDDDDNFYLRSNFQTRALTYEPASD